jgi:hypothetical protein
VDEIEAWEIILANVDSIPSNGLDNWLDWVAIKPAREAVITVAKSISYG